MQTNGCATTVLSVAAQPNKHRIKPRIAKEPCPWCGEEYIQTDARQKQHLRSQNEWCWRQGELARWQRRNQAVSKKRTPKVRTVKIKTIKVPIAFAVRSARRYWGWLMDKYPHDTRQELELALLLTGVKDSLSPAIVDLNQLNYAISRGMREFAIAMGFGRERVGGNPIIPCLVELDQAKRKANWATTWMVA